MKRDPYGRRDGPVRIMFDRMDQNRSKGKSQSRSLPLFFIILVLTWEDLSSRATCDSMIQPSKVVLAHELVKPNIPVIENCEP